MLKTLRKGDTVLSSNRNLKVYNRASNKHNRVGIILHHKKLREVRSNAMQLPALDPDKRKQIWQQIIYGIKLNKALWAAASQSGKKGIT